MPRHPGANTVATGVFQIERHAFEVQDSTPEELAAYTKEQLKVWKTAVRDSGMPLD